MKFELKTNFQKQTLSKSSKLFFGRERRESPLSVQVVQYRIFRLYTFHGQGLPTSFSLGSLLNREVPEKLSALAIFVEGLGRCGACPRSIISYSQVADKSTLKHFICSTIFGHVRWTAIFFPNFLLTRNIENSFKTIYRWITNSCIYVCIS